MGRYLNIGFGKMADDIRDDLYVDKSMLISVLNKRLESRSRFICVSRPRRFGKTMAANMIAAYYSKGGDSHEIFSNQKISKDSSFERNINKYNVIKLDINGAVTKKGKMTITQYYDKNVVSELMKEYPDVEISEDISLPEAL